MTTYMRVEVVKKTIRYEFPNPVTAKVVGLGTAWVEQEFLKLNGREVQYENDWWLEGSDEGVAFVFEVEERTGEQVQG